MTWCRELRPRLLTKNLEVKAGYAVITAIKCITNNLLLFKTNPSLNFRFCLPNPALEVKRELRGKLDFLLSRVAAFFDFLSSLREFGIPCKVARWLEFRKNWDGPVGVLGEGMLFQKDAGAIRQGLSLKKGKKSI